MAKRAIRIMTGVALGAVMAVVAVSLLMTGAGGATAFNASGGEGDERYPNRYEKECADGVAVLNPDDNAGLVADCAALLTLQETLVGTGELDWAVNRRIHSWEGAGITFVDNENAYRVTQLTLNDKQLTGSMNEAIEKLVRLEGLNLSTNQLTGEIPPEIGSLTNLVSLQLGNNLLTGSIPSEIGNLVNLETLTLHNNRLTGALPAEMGNLVNLTLTGFGRNQFSGCIPVSLRDILHTWDVDDIGLPFCDAATATAALGATATAIAAVTATAEAGTVTPTATNTAAATATPTATATRAPAATATATRVPAATATATATRVPAATATRTPVPTATATRVPTTGGSVVERLIALERQVAALASRVAALEGGAAAATPTRVAQNCVREVPEGEWFSGTWAAGCVTSHPPASDPGGVYYARFYTFTLAHASDVTITLSSTDASPHLLLLRGAGRGGAIVQEASPVSVDPDSDVVTISDTISIRASLAAGSYTIESTTYYAGETGDFRLSLSAGQ